jgi:hypothetical protein
MTVVFIVGVAISAAFQSAEIVSRPHRPPLRNKKHVNLTLLATFALVPRSSVRLEKGSPG